MALSADKPRKFDSGVDPMFNDLPVQASTTVYSGGALSHDSNGDVGPLAASETFVGFAEQQLANTTAGAKSVRVRQKGIIQLTVTGVDDANDIGATVYATDDNTFTLTASGGVSVGKVVRWIVSTTCEVYFEGAQVRSI